MSSSWTLDVDNTKTPNNDADACAAESSSSRWQRHGIYLVPAFIKELNPKAYRPQVVSLGPFHHGSAELLPMEEHKQRALRHLLRRSGRPLEELRAAVQDAAEQLAVTAYRDLGAGSHGDEGRERLVDMLVVDGCFLLEAMRVAAAGVEGRNKDDGGDGGGDDDDDYASSDPVFSRHGVVYVMPFVRRDMLMLENQLPLLVLQRLLAVVTAQPPSHGEINRMVLKFLSPSSSSSRLPPPQAGGDELGLHPLDVYRSSLVQHGVHWNNNPRDDDDYDPYQQDQEEPAIIRPALELQEAGVRFKKSRRSSNTLRDIRFQSRHGGVLSVPALTVDDSTEYVFLNMMAFEKLHAAGDVGGNGGSDVAAYVCFMSNVLGSARDVALLCSEGIIQNAAAGSDSAVARMFERMSRDTVLEPESAVDAVQRQVSAYCFRRRRRRRRMCGIVGTGDNKTTWTWSVVVAVVLVVLIVQTVYTAVQLYMLRRRR